MFVMRKHAKAVTVLEAYVQVGKSRGRAVAGGAKKHGTVDVLVAGGVKRLAAGKIDVDAGAEADEEVRFFFGEIELQQRRKRNGVNGRVVVLRIGSGRVSSTVEGDLVPFFAVVKRGIKIQTTFHQYEQEDEGHKALLELGVLLSIADVVFGRC